MLKATCVAGQRIFCYKKEALAVQKHYLSLDSDARSKYISERRACLGSLDEVRYDNRERVLYTAFSYFLFSLQTLRNRGMQHTSPSLNLGRQRQARHNLRSSLFS